MPPRGSPNGFDQTRVRDLDSTLKARFPSPSIFDSGPVGKLVLNFSKSSLISSQPLHYPGQKRLEMQYHQYQCHSNNQLQFHLYFVYHIPP